MQVRNIKTASDIYANRLPVDSAANLKITPKHDHGNISQEKQPIADQNTRTNPYQLP